MLIGELVVTKIDMKLKELVSKNAEGVLPAIYLK